jgi:hypothetical protein
MTPMRGSSKEHEEIYKAFFHLISENSTEFLQNEIEMCKGDGAEIVSEYVCHSIVRTMCGQPPKNVSLFDLKVRNCSIEFSKMDYLLLLGLAKKALGDYLRKEL